MLNEHVLVVSSMMTVILATADVVISVRNAQVVEHLIFRVEYHKACATLQFSWSFVASFMDVQLIAIVEYFHANVTDEAHRDSVRSLDMIKQDKSMAKLLSALVTRIGQLRVDSILVGVQKTLRLELFVTICAGKAKFFFVSQ